MSSIYRRGGGFYRQCPFCGANLDPGENCDCGRKEAPAERQKDPLEAAIEKLERELGISHEGN